MLADHTARFIPIYFYFIKDIKLIELFFPYLNHFRTYSVWHLNFFDNFHWTRLMEFNLRTKNYFDLSAYSNRLFILAKNAILKSYQFSSLIINSISKTD